MSSNELVPFRFHEDTLSVVKDGERLGVTLASLCAPFGLDTEGQRNKLSRLEWACTFKVKAQLPGDIQTREVVCLDLDSVSGWLFTLQTKSLAPDIRAKVVAYQRECARVLADHFLGKRGATQATALNAVVISAVRRHHDR